MPKGNLYDQFASTLPLRLRKQLRKVPYQEVPDDGLAASIKLVRGPDGKLRRVPGLGLPANIERCAKERCAQFDACPQEIRRYWWEAGKGPALILLAAQIAAAYNKRGSKTALRQANAARALSDLGLD